MTNCHFFLPFYNYIHICAQLLIFGIEHSDEIGYLYQESCPSIQHNLPWVLPSLTTFSTSVSNTGVIYKNRIKYNNCTISFTQSVGVSSPEIAEIITTLLDEASTELYKPSLSLPQLQDSSNQLVVCSLLLS